ncbi:MAG: exodeoxyribonuclease VII large subunit [Candidatus Melainabacteria bacterium]|nr:MAG: exodeoxyribonuclease VII large subunit [Candidatus Melainabacteria bacterium]
MPHPFPVNTLRLYVIPIYSTLLKPSNEIWRATYLSSRQTGLRIVATKGLPDWRAGQKRKARAILYGTSNPLRQVLSVSQLTAQVRVLIEDVFTDVYVVGEISNTKVYPSGHWYFSLKDKEATLPCVCFKTSNQAIKFRLEDGLMIVARGKLTVYPPRGAYQMVVNAVEPVGIGDWQLAFEQLKKQLESEGLLANARKRSLPLVPRRIGVVTSTAGAAIKDILSALKRRNKNVSIVIAPARVQGDGSAQEIAQALADLQTDPAIEVIIIARGGGSIEDLWSFNTETVARAVANCRVPIISGVGHETDVTICDLVADMRAPTPTAAAELVAKGRSEIAEKCDYFQGKLVTLMEGKLRSCRQSLLSLNPLSFLIAHEGRLKRHRLELKHQQERMIVMIARCLAEHRHRWRANAEKLASLGPLSVLRRGFSILRNRQGEVVCSVDQIEPGDELEALMEHGKLVLVVKAKSAEWQYPKERLNE